MKQLFSVLLLASLLAVGCTSTTSSKSSDGNEETDSTAAHCSEPENPYSEGTGHHAGYEWAEQHNPGTCGGSSQSFIEGCEEYQNQESEYEECKAQKNK